MTPAEHKAAAEALLTTYEANATTGAWPQLQPNGSQHYKLLAHAVLSKAAGTGTHYDAADSALAAAEAADNQLVWNRRAVLALAHAHLAD